MDLLVWRQLHRLGPADNPLAIDLHLNWTHLILLDVLRIRGHLGWLGHLCHWTSPLHFGVHLRIEQFDLSYHLRHLRASTRLSESNIFP